MSDMRDLFKGEEDKAAHCACIIYEVLHFNDAQFDAHYISAIDQQHLLADQ